MDVVSGFSRSRRQIDTAVGPLWVDPRDRNLGKTLVKHGVYEPDWTAWFLQTIAPGAHIVDVGANIGYYTVLFGRQAGRSGRVLSCEPDAVNHELLTRNVDANDLAPQVTIAATALGDRTGSITLHRDPRAAGVHSISRANLPAPEAATEVSVAVDTLDELVARTLGRVDLIKMDAQGAEGLILRGATRTLAANRALTVVIELWPQGLRHCGSSLDEVLARFERDGFRAHLLKKDAPVLSERPYDELRRRAERLDNAMAAFNAAFIRA